MTENNSKMDIKEITSGSDMNSCGLGMTDWLTAWLFGWLTD
jgi:hypothetical protein